MSRTSNVPENETKAQKSVRLAVARMPRALKGLASIANLGTKSYEFSDAQKAKMLKDLETGVQSIRDAFAGKAAAVAGDYTL